MQEELEDLRDCGLGNCRPAFLQSSANIKVLTYYFLTLLVPDVLKYVPSNPLTMLTFALRLPDLIIRQMSAQVLPRPVPTRVKAFGL